MLGGVFSDAPEASPMAGTGGTTGADVNGGRVKSRLRAIRVPLLSGLAGGVVVAAFGAVAISAGWVAAAEPTGADSPLASASTQPVSDDGGRPTGTPAEIYASTGEGVVHVEAGGSAPSSPLEPGAGGIATGSGFVIDTEGHIVTNAHVVEGADEVEVTFGEDSEPVSAEVIGSDPSTDLALLRADAPSSELHPLTLGSSSDIEVGAPVVAIGNPFGLDRTLTSGIVSAVHRQIQAPNSFTISEAIQTDAPINPGNSGGPLIDASGHVIGVNSQIATGGGNGSVGIGFAVPVDTVREVVEQLLSSGDVSHAYLGLTVADVDADLADVLNLDVTSGALVQEVVPGGPAADAGIEEGEGRVSVAGSDLAAGGDVIVAIGDQPVRSGDDVIAAVDAHEPGDQVELDLVRGDERLTVTAILGERPDAIDAPAPAEGKRERPLPDIPEIPGFPPEAP